MCSVSIRDTNTSLGSLPSSLHLPAASTFDDSGNFASSDLESRFAQARKGKIVCVAGSKSGNGDTQDVAGKLLSLGVNRLCTLHNGMEIFRPLAGVLCVPDT